MAKPLDEQFPPNSRRSSRVPVNESRDDGRPILNTEEKRKVKAKVKVRRSVKKTTIFSFLYREGKEILGYVLSEVIIPGIKDTFQSSIEDGIDMLFNAGDGDSRRVGRRGTSRVGPRVISYGNFYNNGRRGKLDSREHMSRKRKTNRLEAYTFEFIEDAQEVLTRLINAQIEYGFVSVSEFLEAAGVAEAIEPQDANQGWEDEIQRARVKRTGANEYIISFPPTVILSD